MGKLVSPKVFLVGFTDVNVSGLKDYLEHTGQTDFLQTFVEAIDDGISPGEALCSFYAKLCYKSLVRGKSANVTRVRDVRANLASCHDTGHGSVFEHCSLNFVVTDCSRVYTHEQVRHRPGWAYSQTSGRYCRLDSIDLVWDTILDPVKDLWLSHLGATENLVYLTECKLGLRKPPHGFDPAEVPAEFYLFPVHGEPGYEDGDADFPSRLLELCEDVAIYDALTPEMQALVAKIRAVEAEGKKWITPDNTDLDVEARATFKWVPDDQFDFDRRKQITSAIRRIAPNGQANEMGMTCNIRALRHAVAMRTARFAETEIRNIFNQIYGLVKGRFPSIFFGAKERLVGDYLEIYGMKQSPYEIDAKTPGALEMFTTEQLQAELQTRTAV